MKTLENLFERYGHPWDEGELKIWAYLYKPSALTKTADVVSCDNTAMRAIKECEEALALLNSYREELQKRYAALETMAYTEVVRLQRHNSCYKGISYELTTVRRYSDGSETTVDWQSWPGKERHLALRAYKQRIASRPGVAAECDISK